VTPRISENAYAILSAFLAAYSEGLTGSAKVALAADIDALLAEGHDPEELTRAVQAFAANASEPAEHFGAWVRSRSRLRTYWIKD